MSELRPSQFCRELLATLDASEGRRRQRKRNTTPDALGLAMKRNLVQGAIAADPEPGDFEAWLFERCLAEGPSNGGWHAVALSLLEEWRLAAEVDEFRAWLDAGAPSDDKRSGPHASLMAVAAIGFLAVLLAGCRMDHEERQTVLEAAQHTHFAIARGAVVRDLRSPSDTGRLIYSEPIHLSQRTAHAAGARQMWAPFGIARPDTVPPRATTAQ